MCQNFSIANSYLVETNFASVVAGQSYSLGNQQQLVDKYIYAVEFHTSTQLSTTPLGFTVISLANAATVLINLQSANGEIPVQQLPVYKMVPNVNGGFTLRIVPQKIDFPNSKLQLTATGISAGQSAAITFYYYNQLPQHERAVAAAQAAGSCRR